MKTNKSIINQSFDAVIIGGGPAGSTCAYKLASQGHSVLLLEKSQFPRFHIGESMVPYITKLLEMIGVLDKVKDAKFVKKPGVEFFSKETGDLRRQNFGNLADGQNPTSYNFDRARFDKILLDHANDSGAQVLQEANVKKLILDGDRVVGVEYQHQGKKYEVRAPYVIDASGRAGIIDKHFHIRKMNKKLENVVVFQHYKNVVKENNPAVEGDVIFSAHEDGWLWGIPLANPKKNKVSSERSVFEKFQSFVDTLLNRKSAEYEVFSVGAVMPKSILKKSNPKKVFDAHCKKAPRIKDAIKGAKPVFRKPKVESDFCYYSEQFTGPGYFVIGDAACFVDPVFSGGVFLSMICGLKAAEAIDAIFKGKDKDKECEYFENFCKTGYDTYYRVVYSYYNEFKRDMNRMGLELPGGFHFVLQTFAGDFWGEPDQPVLSYLRSKEEWNTFEKPFELIFDCPIYPDVHYKAADIPNLPPLEDFDSISSTEKEEVAV